MDFTHAHEKTLIQMKLSYLPQDPTPPRIQRIREGMPECILNFRLNKKIRKMVFDPNNTKFWNRINRRRI